jgi:hypothetical protein
MCVTPLIFGGCVMKHNCLSHTKQFNSRGWITIAGPAVPAMTTPVDEAGVSLANCLLDSRIVEILELQGKDKRVSTNFRGGRQISQAEMQFLLILLQRTEGSTAPLTHYAAVVREVETLQLSYPQLLSSNIPNPLGYVFDPAVSTEQDRAQLRMHIQMMPDHTQRQAADRAFETLMTSSAPKSSATQCLDLLNQLVHSGALRIDDSQRARSWSYATVNELHGSASNFSVDGGVETAAQTKVLGLVQNVRPNAEMGASLSGATETVVDPLDTIFVIMEQQNRGAAVTPLASVFDSPIGGIWMLPGDSLKLARLRDIAFLDGQFGQKRVGLTGMASQRGIIETDDSKLKPFLYRVDKLIDVRSNLIVVSYQVGSSSIKLLMPYSVTPYDAGPAVQHSSQLQSSIGLRDGAVVTFEHTDFSPLLKKSKEFMQAAAAKPPVDSHCHANRLCSTKKFKPDGTPKPKDSASCIQFPEVPIVSDTRLPSKLGWKLNSGWEKISS